MQGKFPRVLQIYVSFFSKIAPLASGVHLKTRFEDGPGALADSYAVENTNVDFEDLSHTSQRTKSCLHTVTNYRAAIPVVRLCHNDVNDANTTWCAEMNLTLVGSSP